MSGMDAGVSRLARYGRGAKQLPFTAIPIIGLAPLFGGGEAELRRVAAAIDDACRKVGFFYIRNHGVLAPVIARAFAATEIGRRVRPDR